MVILSTWPRVVDPFRQGEHDGKDFAYGVGIVRDDNEIVKVAAGILTLDDDTVSYVSVNSAGNVFFSTGGYQPGSIPLYKVTSVGGEITEVSDDRSFFSVSSGGGCLQENAINLKGATNIAMNSSAISINVTIPMTVLRGDLLIAHGFTRNSPPNFPAGWIEAITQKITGGSPILDQYHYIYYKRAENSDIGTTLTVGQSTAGRLELGLIVAICPGDVVVEAADGTDGRYVASVLPPVVSALGSGRLSVISLSGIVSDTGQQQLTNFYSVNFGRLSMDRERNRARAQAYHNCMQALLATIIILGMPWSMLLQFPSFLR